MIVLIDSHTMIWALDDPGKLPSTATMALQDPKNDLRLSAASVWEIAIKVGKGNLPLSLPFRVWIIRRSATWDCRSFRSRSTTPSAYHHCHSTTATRSTGCWHRKR